MSSYSALLDKIAANWALLKRIPKEKINADVAIRSLENSVQPYIQGLIPKNLMECVELNAKKLLKDLFGGKVFERYFRESWSSSLDT